MIKGKMFLFFSYLIFQINAWSDPTPALFKYTCQTTSASVEELDSHPLDFPFTRRDIAQNISKIQAKNPAIGEVSTTPFQAASSPSQFSDVIAMSFEDMHAYPSNVVHHPGKDQIIVIGGARLRSFNKYTMEQDNVLDMTLETFFQKVLPSGGFCIHPKVRYDRKTGVWVVAALGNNANATSNSVMCAYTTDSIITPQSRWHFFSLLPSSNPQDKADHLILGMDENAIHLGMNLFNGSTNTLSSSTAVVIAKNQMTATAQTIFAYSFGDLLDRTTFVGAHTPVPVDNYDDNPMEQYMIATDGAEYGLHHLYRIINTKDQQDVPAIEKMISFYVTDATAPLNIDHKGNIQGLAGRLGVYGDHHHHAHHRNSVIHVAHHVGVGFDGESSPSELILTTGSRFYEIDIRNLDNPVITWLTTMYDRENKMHFFLPSMKTNGVGARIATFYTAGNDDYISANYAMHYPEDDPNQIFRKFTTHVPGTTAYNPLFDVGNPTYGRAWPSHHEIHVDPEDDMTFWATSQVADPSGNFEAHLSKISHPAPAKIASCSPSTILSNQLSLSLIITGEDTGDGRRFYDPLADFAKHIQLTAGDVKVLHVEQIGPTTLRADVSTVGTAPGVKHFVVVNPDGQTSTDLTGLLTVE